MKAPSLAISILFAVVAAALVATGHADTASMQLQSAIASILAVWRTWQAYRGDGDIVTTGRAPEQTMPFWGGVWRRLWVG